MEKTTPKINYKYYSELCIKLDKSINSKDEKNVAISGILGSGKSSMVATYKSAFNNKEGEKLVNQYKEKISKENENADEFYKELDDKLDNLQNKEIKPSLTISLANFNITNKYIKEEQKKDNNKSDINNNVKKDDHDYLKNKIKDDFNKLNKFQYSEIDDNSNNKILEREIEKSLLQQFVFGVNQSKISDSKISRVIPKQSIRISAIVFFILTLCLGAIFSINHSSLFWEFNKPIEIVFATLGIVTFITMSSLFAFLIKIKSFKYDKIEITTEDNNSLDENLLSKFIDEIVYIFKKSRYQIVFFEDLDRLPNLSIFNKLREINYILNNNPDINHKITFVYCVSDNIISDYEERAKFFDNIITIKPYVTVENLKTKIESILKNIKGERNEDKIAEFATDMSKFMVDSRLSHYIENDFYDLKLKYKENEKEITTEELLKIYALAIYKNLYYYDYNKLSVNDACLCESFDLIRILKNDISKEIENDIDKIENDIKSANESVLINTDEMLRLLMRGIINQLPSSANYNNRFVELSSLTANDINNFEKIRENGRYVDINNIKEIFKNKFHISLEEYINNISINNEEKLNDLRIKLDSKRKNIKDIMSYSVSEFISKYGCNEINNNFLHLCLKKGYIEGDYKKYLFGIDGSYLDESDDAFVRYNNFGEINSPIKNNYLYHLKAIKKVIKEIYLEKFATEKILNIDIYNYFLDSKSSSDKTKKFNSLLLSDSEEVLRFFIEYIKTQDIEYILHLFNSLYNSSKLLEALFEAKDVISRDKFNKIVEYLTNKIDLKDLNSENKIKCINLLNSIKDYKNLKLDNEKNLVNLDIKFIDISTFNQQSLNKIINNNLYEINESNLKEISDNFDDLTPNDRTLDVLLNSNEIIKNNIINNLEKVLECLEEQNINDLTALSLMSNSDISNENKMLLISNVDFRCAYFDGIERDIFKSLIEEDKLQYDIESIYMAYKLKLDVVYSKYFKKDTFYKINFNGLDDIKNDENYLGFIETIVYPNLLNENNVDIAKKFDLHDIKLDALNTTSKMDSIILRLIENNIVEFSENNLRLLNECYKSYSKLIENYSDEFIVYEKCGIISVSSNLLTYLIYKCNNEDIKLFLLNEYYNDINFAFRYENESYITYLINYIENCSKLKKEVIQKLFGLTINDDATMLKLLEILKRNKNLFNKNEIFTLVSKLNPILFTNFNIGYEFSKQLTELTKECVHFLESEEIIKLSRRKQDVFKIKDMITT